MKGTKKESPKESPLATIENLKGGSNTLRTKQLIADFTKDLKSPSKQQKDSALGELKSYIDKGNSNIFTLVCKNLDDKLHEEVILSDEFGILKQCYKHPPIVRAIFANLDGRKSIQDTEKTKELLITKFVTQFLNDYPNLNKKPDATDQTEKNIIEFLTLSIKQITIGKMADITSNRVTLTMVYKDIDTFLFGLVPTQERPELIESSIKHLIPIYGQDALIHLVSLWPENKRLVVNSFNIIVEAFLLQKDKSKTLERVANIVEGKNFSQKDKVVACYTSFKDLSNQNRQVLLNLFINEKTLPEYAAKTLIQNGFLVNMLKFSLPKHLTTKTKELFEEIPVRGEVALDTTSGKKIANDNSILRFLSVTSDIYHKILIYIVNGQNKHFLLHYRDCLESFSFSFTCKLGRLPDEYKPMIRYTLSSGSLQNIYARFLILLAGSTAYGEGADQITQYAPTLLLSDDIKTSQPAVDLIHKNLCDQLSNILKIFNKSAHSKILTALEQGISYLSHVSRNQEWLSVLGKLHSSIQKDYPTNLQTSNNLTINISASTYLLTTAVNSTPDMLSYNLLKERWLAQPYEAAKFTRENFLPLLSFSALIYDNSNNKAEIMNFAHELFLLEFGQKDILKNAMPSLHKEFGLNVCKKILSFCQNVISEIQTKYPKPNEYSNYLHNSELSHIRLAADEVWHKITQHSPPAPPPSGEDTTNLTAKTDKQEKRDIA